MKLSILTAATLFSSSCNTVTAFAPSSMNARRQRLGEAGRPFGVVSSSSHQHHRRASRSFDFWKLYAIGVFFGTSTGSTEDAAYLIVEEFGEDAVGPIEIDSIQGSVAAEFAKYDALIVGTPTWNTGADVERSGVGWDEIYYGEMQDLDVGGKKVAVFGLGDSVSYAENYADASGELHDVFEGLGCKMMGYTSQEGYEHEASKAIRGDKFCGLLLDAVNQEDLTPDRVSNWVAQLKDEGILEGGSGGGAAVAPVAAAEPVVVEADPVVTAAPATSAVSNGVSNGAAAPVSAAGGYTPHANEKTGKTMWISADGRSCYFTSP
mmetsp:Transcript_21173/g.29940  ORF Transcript_21173/g.29940 Transcript_21173/m.29940 type:complete len:321 (+) Transcript_21173:84-1046(+)